MDGSGGLTLLVNPTGVSSMAVDQVSARSVLATASAGAQDASALKDGTQLEGRVVAINPDATLKLSTRYGVLDVDPSQVSLPGRGARSSLPALSDLLGALVKIEITGQSAAGRLAVKLISGGETAAATTDPSGASDAATRIAAEVSRAAARQDGLAQVFAGAQQLAANSGDVPDAVTTAIDDLIAQALDLAAPPTAEAIRDAMSASGLFLEAKLARLAAGGDAAAFSLDPQRPLVTQDLKAALFGLKSTLEDWIAAGPAELAVDEPPPALALDTASAHDVDTPSAQQSEAAAQAPRSAQVDTEALFAVMRPPPDVAQTTSQSIATSLADFGLLAQLANSELANAGRPDLIAMATLGEWLQATGQLPGYRRSASDNGRRRAYSGESASPDSASPHGRTTETRTTRPPPPRRGSPPRGQAAVVTDNAGSTQATDLARALAAKAGDGLARMSLGQYASLPEPASRSARGSGSLAPSTAWLFEIPFRLGPAVSIGQFEIDPIGGDGGAETDAGAAWRIQFSLEIAPLGPLHARVLLTGRRLSIGLWAEDRTGALNLQRGLLGLRQSLEVADFTIDEIHFALGRPPQGPPIRAGGFVDRNA
jgi:hypothetical protein